MKSPQERIEELRALIRTMTLLIMGEENRLSQISNTIPFIVSC